MASVFTASFVAALAFVQRRRPVKAFWRGTAWGSGLV